MTIATAGNWAGNWFVFTQSSSSTKKSALMTKSISTGTASGWMALDESATIELLEITKTAGSIDPAMSRVDLPVEELDEIDAEIALMSEREIIEAVLASAGTWADRDDLNGILDRRDRIDELYAPYIPNDPDTSI
jgi:hypothetical protein